MNITVKTLDTVGPGGAGKGLLVLVIEREKGVEYAHVIGTDSRTDEDIREEVIVSATGMLREVIQDVGKQEAV